MTRVSKAVFTYTTKAKGIVADAEWAYKFGSPVKFNLTRSIEEMHATAALDLAERNHLTVKNITAYKMPKDTKYDYVFIIEGTM